MICPECRCIVDTSDPEHISCGPVCRVAWGREGGRIAGARAGAVCVTCWRALVYGRCVAPSCFWRRRRAASGRRRAVA